MPHSKEHHRSRSREDEQHHKHEHHHMRDKDEIEVVTKITIQNITKGIEEDRLRAELKKFVDVDLIDLSASKTEARVCLSCGKTTAEKAIEKLSKWYQYYKPFLENEHHKN